MSNGSGQPGPAQRLPIIGTIVVAYGFTFRHARPILAAAVVPFVVAMLTNLRGLLAQREEGMTHAAELLWWILPIIAVTPFATQCQRFFLDPEPANRPRFGFPWSRRETQFLLHLVGLFALMIGLNTIALPLVGFLPSESAASARGTLGIVVIAAVLVLTIYLVARMMLILPAAAIGLPLAWSESWRRTAGHGASLSIIIVLVPLPWLIPSAVDLIAGPQAVQLWRYLAMTALIEACSLISTAVMMVALAAAYRWIMGSTGAVTPAGGAT